MLENRFFCKVPVCYDRLHMNQVMNMIIEKNRHMNELIKLLNTDGSVTAEELASFTDFSVRTVKNDMKYLNEELKASEGCEICAHKGRCV